MGTETIYAIVSSIITILVLYVVRYGVYRSTGKSYRLLECVVQRSDVVAYITDESGVIIYANDKACHKLGYSQFELLKMHVTDVDMSLSIDNITSMRDKVLSKGCSFLETSHRQKNGDMYSVEITVTPLESDGSKYILFVARDISQAKQAQAELRFSHERFRRLALLRDMEEEEKRKQLANNVHEGIGQYLMALRMSISMLSNKSTLGLSSCGESLSCSEYLRNMFDNVEKSVQLVREVTWGLRPSVLDAGIVAALEWLFGRLESSTSINCDLHLPESDVVIDERAALAIFRASEVVVENIESSECKSVSVSLHLRDGNAYLVITLSSEGLNNESLHKQFMQSLAWLGQQIDTQGGEVNTFVLQDRGVIIDLIIPVSH